MTHKVAIVHCKDYSEKNVSEALDRAFELLGGLNTFISSTDSVLLKPNLLFDNHPDKAVTTHPMICSVVAKKVKEITKTTPLLGDSPACTISDYNALIEKTGMKEYSKRGDFSCVNFANEGVTNYEVPNGKIFKTVPIANTCLNADVLINLPKLKTHTLMHLTCAVKNLFGAVLGFCKTECHKMAPHSSELAEVFIHLANILKPKLTIMDAVIGMDGDGPGSGRPFPINAILVGSNPYAVDVAASLLVHNSPDTVPILKMARHFGVQVPALSHKNDSDRLQIVGDSLDFFNTYGFQIPQNTKLDLIPSPIIRFGASFIKVYPKIIPELCIRCYRCSGGCPVGALSAEKELNKPPILDKKKCIHCFCCQEICPQKSIKLNSNFLMNLILKRREKAKNGKS